LNTVRKAYTKRQQEMYFASLEDLTGHVEILVFPRAVEKTGDLWHAENIVIVSGKVTNEDGMPKIIVESAERVDMYSVETFKRIQLTRQKNERLESEPLADQKIVITLKTESVNQHLLQTLSSTLGKLPKGDSPVYVKVQGTLIHTPHSIQAEENSLEQLKKMEGIENVER
jgi:DNA polymerase III alpha subunit